MSQISASQASQRSQTSQSTSRADTANTRTASKERFDQRDKSEFETLTGSGLGAPFEFVDNLAPFQFVHTPTPSDTPDTAPMQDFTGGSGGGHGTAQFLEQQNEKEITQINHSLVNKLDEISTLRDMSFSIENSQGRISVEAKLSGGALCCAMRTSSEELREKLQASRIAIASALGSGLKTRVELDISIER